MNKRGNIRKTTGDFAVRQGLTQRPLADVDFVGKFVQRNIIGQMKIFFQSWSWGKMGQYFFLLNFSS